MNHKKTRQIILFILVGIIIAQAIMSWFAINRTNLFKEEINKLNLNYTTSSGIKHINFNIEPIQQIASIFLPLVFIGIFLIFAFIYAYNKKNISQNIRKWPYIVMIVLFSISFVFGLFTNLRSIIQDKIKFDSDIPTNIQNQINTIYKTKYATSIKIFQIIDLILAILKIIITIYLLVLTVKIKNASDIDYSKKVASFSKKQNDLP